MKTSPMDHQAVGSQLLAENPEYYGLGAEQGTGKTWMLLADIERAKSDKQITGAVVIAPKGVHTNWVRREIPAHLELEVDDLVWKAGPGVRQKAEMARILSPSKIRGELPLLAMNIDAVNNKLGYNYLRAFLRAHKSMLIIDESSRIKNPTAGRTKRLLSVAPLAVCRRIASGTMMPNGPPDLFAQMEFLAPEGKLLGTYSYRAFVSQYAEVLPKDHPLMEHLIEKMKARRGVKKLHDKALPFMIDKYPDGTPKWKNLDALQQLIKPYIFRVLKKDCMDLPDKIYQTYSFPLTASQRRVYDEAEKKLRYERDTGQIDAFSALTRIIKLRQIVSGFIMLDGEATTLAEDKDNPRLQLFTELVEDLREPFIVWATFHEEIQRIAAVLDKLGIKSVQYHGKVKDAERENAVDDFQNGNVQCFIGQPQSGGIGLTLTAATTVIYYSSDYNSETRMQSEDRAHRRGTTKNVLYITLAAEDTIDERIIAALLRKEEVSNRVLNYL